MKKCLSVYVALLLALLAMACTASEKEEREKTPQTVEVVAREWGFSPPRLDLTAGRPVNLVFKNEGALEHDVTIPSLNVSLKAAPGAGAQTTFTPDSSATVEIYCSLAGHKEAGMQASLVVSDDGRPLTAQGSGAPAHASHAAVATTSTRGNQELAYRVEGGTKVFDITAKHVRWEVLPNELVDAYAYNGQLPGPVMRVTEGERLRLDFRNELPEPTVVHFHGPSLPNNMDGVVDVTQKVIEPGNSFSYEFVAKPAGTFVYHTHHNSAVQEPKGLYGMFIIEPKEGPRVAYDKEVFQVISEFGGNFVINGKAFPATEVIEGKVGEKVLIRLANLGQMSHPMHLHGHPFKIVATDGYPVPEAMRLTKDVVNIGPGERYDLLVELDNPGVWVFHCHILSHVQNHGVEPGGMITVLKVAG